MRREPHVRFCERAGVRLPCATHRNIYVRSRRAGERVMASVSRFLTQKLRLKVNEAKSAVARPEERKFLGFSIANDAIEPIATQRLFVDFFEKLHNTLLIFWQQTLVCKNGNALHRQSLGVGRAVYTAQ